MTAAQEAKIALTHKGTEPQPISDKDFLSMGLTLGNLSTYGRSNGGLKKGHIYRFAGRPSGGKTFVCRGILAEACRNPEFDDYELIYDDIERGALMDTQRYFGQSLVDRLLAPAYAKDGEPIYSSNLDDFYKRLGDRLNKGKKVIWIADSYDALDAATTKMGDGKAKQHSQNMRKLLEPMEATGSILVGISQARSDIKTMPMFRSGDITSGGRALEHYATLEIWLTKIASLKRTYKDKSYNVGVRIKAFVKKNRISGVDRAFTFPLYYSLGVDDLGSCCEFLVDCGHWSSLKGIVTAPEFDFEGNMTMLVRKIEGEQLQRELQILTSKVWHQIEAAVTPKREPRYQ